MGRDSVKWEGSVGKEAGSALKLTGSIEWDVAVTFSNLIKQECQIQSHNECLDI
jgi:hypothetical protein